MAIERGSRSLAICLGGGAYAVFYLYALGDLDSAPTAWSWASLDWEWSRLWAMRSSWQFEALALLQLGPLVILLSPLNLLFAALLGLLLALNLDGALALREAAQCSLASRNAWSVGAWPALLAGGACCAPSLLLLIGIPGLGAFIGLFAWLLPLSFVLLLSSRLWQRGRGVPPVLGWL